MNNSYTVEDAKRKLEHYCAYQERCHKDVYTKLLGMKMIPEAIDVIIVHLIDNNFLNEERFAKAFVSGKFNIKKWGKRRLELELKRRDISSYNINQALKTITDEDYYNAIDQLARKRCNALKETDTFKKKKKLVDYLLYRGWETHLVYDKVNELIP
ncbi:Regulatory protein RecX [Mesoflavibacter sp. HG96]|uniref:regulatory protein RecX n=1 Tax=unclassified Mesoflavibacter TaxID=2630131 RepID=UPI000D0EB21B|nr:MULTISPECIES: regulatory protein RecX [unclassified Mesoflavibacter]QIJ89069.1 Regulatory protein RecX [Mesoflavibacter sp. HG96]QIJ91797.1 Regulatory protein RecX [Mesoflavibacter sp. HG37]